MIDSIVEIFSRSFVLGPGFEVDVDVDVEGFDGDGRWVSGSGCEMEVVTREDADGSSTSFPSVRVWINRWT